MVPTLGEMKWAIMRIQVENAKYRRQCPVCRANYTYKPAGKDKGHEHKRGLFCSQECRHVDVVSRREAKAAAPKPLSRVRTFKCAGCNSPFTSDRKRAYCRVSCRPARVAFSYKQRCECKECGASFEQMTYDGRPVLYCSDVCREEVLRRRRGVQRSKRKARLRGASIENVDPVLVFEYDAWTCMICVQPTPKEKRGTYAPDAPELDHIVPLAKGGAHSYANTQTLCRSCNQAKSDTLVPSLRDLL